MRPSLPSLRVDRPAKPVLTEQRQDVLRVRVGDRQGLDGELLLGLQSLQASGLFVHVSIDQTTDTLVDGGGQVGNELFLHTDTHGDRAKRSSRACPRAQEIVRASCRERVCQYV